MPLAATSLACVLVGAAIPFTPIGHLLGFTPLPPLFFAALAAMVVTYLVLVEIAKTLFYRRHLTGRPTGGAGRWSGAGCAALGNALDPSAAWLGHVGTKHVWWSSRGPIGLRQEWPRSRVGARTSEGARSRR